VIAALFGAACASVEGGARDATIPAAEDAIATSEAWRVVVEDRLVASRPGVQMRRLSPMVGDWVVEVEAFEANASPLSLAQGTATITAELGGRFLVWRTQMQVAGQGIESRGLLGYDRELERYELLWITELSSGQRIARGAGDPERGGIYLEASIPDAESGALRHSRSVLELHGPDCFSLEQWELDPASSEWILSRRTTYRRS
jgi:hypothetical protein